MHKVHVRSQECTQHQQVCAMLIRTQTVALQTSNGQQPQQLQPLRGSLVKQRTNPTPYLQNQTLSSGDGEGVARVLD